MEPQETEGIEAAPQLLPRPRNRIWRAKWYVRTALIIVALLASGGIVMAVIPARHNADVSDATASSKSATTVTAGANQEAASSTASTASIAATPAPKSAANPQAALPSGQNAAGRLVVETASLALAATHPEEVAARVSAMATHAGGFVQQLVTSGANGTTSMTVRIPEPKFNSFLGRTESLGSVSSFTQTGQDVTEEHGDLTSQLTQLEGESAAYTRLYDKAQTMKDMLQIEQSLSEVNNQIAQLDAQLHDLNRSVQLSTIHLTIAKRTPAASSQSYTSRLALSNSLHFMKTSAHALLIFFAWVLPWAVTLGVIGGGVWWVVRRTVRRP
ncbi:DUF4349 domain-containing protein [Alicyclobacillus fastidiosus]|uniref:DUF4349 domain-containing protein n=1 Tax=Alicyclobacillus fastidiosus TaxID=392011 RepID=A0ABV5ABP2_9BACL|nr:DUF4349 domain-containing protein [Alicyclobacillus fastidiosus]WEH10349.1 DUF4349 domain-containing protein [Alicyclobacillus fastidiosus]